MSAASQCVETQTELSTEFSNQDCEIQDSSNSRDKLVLLNKTKDKLYQEIVSLEHDIAENRLMISSLELERENLAKYLSKISKEVEITKELVSGEDSSEFPGSTQESKINYTRKVGRKIIVFSDSQGRELANLLMNIIPHQYSVSSFVYPGAGMCQILDAVHNCREVKQLNRDDYLIVMGGTNDFDPSSNEKDIVIFRLAVESLLLQMKHTNLIIGTVPYRYDMSASSSINRLIKLLNGHLRKIIPLNAMLLNTWDLTAKEHTRHGLHINKRGKIKIANRIYNIIRDTLHERQSCFSPQMNKFHHSIAPPTLDVESSTSELQNKATEFEPINVPGSEDSVVVAHISPDVLSTRNSPDRDLNLNC
ncbi:hypothetical protein LSTR_LSTR015515 [Laodelphax striatellus]|uniref:Uncharacterized protein n=1 Tax=Laodelphax striatellus TaxID=195883 RepID=A0A482XLS1_LAOST|nr:hypothetical protein LSTR_LSTR015515 [Laodelphax striatellus]